MYKLLYPSIRVRTAPLVSVRVRTIGLVLVLVLLFCMCPADFCDSRPESKYYRIFLTRSMYAPRMSTPLFAKFSFIETRLEPFLFYFEPGRVIVGGHVRYAPNIVRLYP